MDRFVRHFQVYRYDTAFHAHQYLQGLYQCGDRKNMERMEEVVPDTDYQALQQFISNSPWDAKEKWIMAKWGFSLLYTRIVMWPCSMAGYKVYANARLDLGQRQRYWVERSFQDAKAACGMADYQVQGWIGWHHHMALVMMVLLFMMEQRVEQPSLGPKLTCKEIEMILARMLPRKDLTVNDLVELIRKRVERRTAIYEKTRLTE